ncbi:MAG: hypothetical protein EHM20_12075 [Alphaproteobacteria bacterium]|jgi:hypothetical protein|nr:MAG: hypothetical protein EHM20_12075 [Alphaproteobacteria bacterium]
MSIKIVKARDFKPENVKFSEPKENKHGGKVVFINYDYEDGRPPKTLRIQMPRMKAPFGISGWDTNKKDRKDTSPTKVSNDTLELSFNDETTDLIDKFEKLDELAIETGVLNSKEFFKKKFDKDSLKLFYKSSVKHYEDEEGERDNKYPPRFKTKLVKTQDGTYTVEVYNSVKERIMMNIENCAETLPKGAECISIVECTGIWIIGEKFGLSWRPIQMKVYRSNNKLIGYSFIDDEEEEEVVEVDEQALIEELERKAKIDRKKSVSSTGESESGSDKSATKLDVTNPFDALEELVEV